MSLLAEIAQLSDISSSDRRRELLRSVTELFMSSERYDQEQLGVFNEIFAMVVDSVAVEARAEFATRIADRADAPEKVVDRLVADEVAVAGPILSRSPVLTDAKLAAVASSSSQQHLLAISSRRVISEMITDVLVRRGDQSVVRNVAGNQGARFSTRGFGELAKRAEGDQELQVRLVARQDLPAETVAALLPVLSETLVKRLAEAGYDAEGRLPPEILSRVRDKLGAAVQKRDRQGRQLEAMLASCLAGSMSLTKLVQELCAEDRAQDLATALARFANVERTLVAGALQSPNIEPIVLVARAVGLPWASFEQIEAMRRRLKMPGYKADASMAGQYQALTQDAARRSIRFIKVSAAVA